MTCYAIRPGDTAALLAQRFTGNAHNRHEPWFQIVNPATATFIPKSRYSVIQAGWLVCVGHVISSPQPVLLPTGVTQRQAGSSLTVLWWAAPLLAVSGLVLAWVFVREHLAGRRASTELMRGFGERFIAEFERPLFRKCPDDPVVKSRLRLAPARHRLEILLAPAGGRTYPNLGDHKRNVEYDVGRVLQVLKNEAFASGPLYAEGSWVVIPFRFDNNSQQEGVP
jgi:hypothetical protein